MPTTRWNKVRRPNVGDPYDKNATGFNPESNIDILDEIDAELSFKLDLLSFLSIKPHKTFTAPSNSYYASPKVGVAGGYKPVLVGGTGNKVWYVYSSSEYTAPGTLDAVLNYYSASASKTVFVISYRNSGYSVIQTSDNASFPSFTTKYDDSDSANQMYGLIKWMAYMGGWATPTLVLTDGDVVLTSADDMDTFTDNGSKFSGSSISDDAVFDNKYIIAHNTQLEVLDESLNVTQVALPSAITSVARLGVYDGYLYVFGYNSDNKPMIAYTSDLSSFLTFGPFTWWGDAGTTGFWNGILFYNSVMFVSWATSLYSAPPRDMCIGVPHIFGDVRLVELPTSGGMISPDDYSQLGGSYLRPNVAGFSGYPVSIYNDGTNDGFVEYMPLDVKTTL